MSELFPGKSKPDLDKLRGGYYTPEPIARFISNWVAQAGPQTLEPSAGDGAILSHLSNVGSPTAIELVSAEAEAAKVRTGVEVQAVDFFEWFSPSRYGQFDGVAGNPPYIRFSNWAPEFRAKPFQLMTESGLKPTKLTNAWMPFVVASVLATRDNGRIGLVLPAELLQVDYARSLRAYLVDNCRQITLVSFSKLVFPGILQEVVLLLATKGSGPAEFRAVEIRDANELADLTVDLEAVQARLHETEKWTKYYLTQNEIEVMRELKNDERLSTFGDFAKVNVGVVTGRNSFFCLNSAKASQLGIEEFTIGLLSRSASIVGTRLTMSDIDAAKSKGLSNRLLAVPIGFNLDDSVPLSKYIESGEQEEVHLGYKCSIRTPWWSVPSTAIPDGFMLRQVSSRLKVATNLADATSTDTVHRVFTHPGVDMDRLAVASLNSITLAFTEILGRSYGGGLLEMEPREATNLPIPDPKLIPKELIAEIDSLVRQNSTERACNLVDQEVLIGTLGISESVIEAARSAHSRLMNRRLRRGRKG